MTSHRDPIRHSHPLCSSCGQREAMVSLNARRSPKSRKAKRAGRYTLKDHALCGPCWRSLCAQHWVHGEVSAQPLTNPEVVRVGAFAERAGVPMGNGRSLDAIGATMFPHTTSFPSIQIEEVHD